MIVQPYFTKLLWNVTMLGEATTEPYKPSYEEWAITAITGVVFCDDPQLQVQVSLGGILVYNPDLAEDTIGFQFALAANPLFVCAANDTVLIAVNTVDPGASVYCAGVGQARARLPIP